MSILDRVTQPKLLSEAQIQELKQHCEKEVLKQSLPYFDQISSGNNSFSFVTELSGIKHIVILESPCECQKILSSAQIHSEFQNYVCENISQYPFCKGIVPVKQFEWKGAKARVVLDEGVGIGGINVADTAFFTEMLRAHRELYHMEYPNGDLNTVDWGHIRSRLLARVSSRTWNPIAIAVDLYIRFKIKVIPESVLAYSSELGVIHRDFHGGNILCKDGHFSTFIDFDTVSLGLQTEDYVYFTLIQGIWRFRPSNRKFTVEANIFAFLREGDGSEDDWYLGLYSQWLLLLDRFRHSDDICSMLLCYNLCKIVEIIEGCIAAHFEQVKNATNPMQSHVYRQIES